MADTTLNSAGLSVGDGSLADGVEARILQSVREQGLGRGDLLPHETDMATRFGVSRGVVREALTRLQGVGFVDRRKRRGTVLTEPDVFSRLARYMMPALFSRASVAELFELRLVMEMGSAELVCDRITDAEVDRLEKIVAREDKARSITARIACDVAFHTALYEAAGNQSLARFQSVLQPFFQQVVADEQSTGQGASSVTHRMLFRLIKRRDAEGFRASLREHLEPHRQRYMQR